MTTDDALILSHAIPDALRAIGLDDLAKAAARLGERLAGAEALVGHLEQVAHQQGRSIARYEREARDHDREVRDYRESAYARQCAIRGPWTHVAIDEQHRGSPEIRLLCEHCNREPGPAYMALDGPPPPIRPRRMSIVSLMTHRFASSREVSPTIHVGRCDTCGTWYVG